MKTAEADISAWIFPAITRQPIELESCWNTPEIRVS